MNTSNYSFIRAEYLSLNILWQILSYIRLAFTSNTIMQSYNVLFVKRESGEFVEWSRTTTSIKIFYTLKELQ